MFLKSVIIFSNLDANNEITIQISFNDPLMMHSQKERHIHLLEFSGQSQVTY